MASSRQRDWGCWTCRLRRLKCDEKRDSCERCLGCNIPCYGYGPKPDWKDGGKREAEKLATVKAGVAANRRRRTLAAKAKRSDADVRSQDPGLRSQEKHMESQDAIAILDEASGTDRRLSSTWSTSAESASQTSPGQGISDELCISGISLDPTSPMPATDIDVEESSIDYWLSRWGSTVEWTAESFELIEALSERQKLLNFTEDRKALLFQHYLDHIFSLQYFHQQYLQSDTLPHEWFFSLLQSISPLQHAALCLSALHMRCLQSDKDDKQLGNQTGSDEDYTALLEEYRSEALKGLRLFIRDHEHVSLTDGYIPILACCSQFVSFDLFQGGTGQWYSHLEAATNLIIDRAASNAQSMAINEPEPHVKHAETFLVGALVWSDILAPASTGRRPKLHALLPRLIGPPQSQDLPIKLENIMGCENEVMLLISEVSALQEWKLDSLDSRSYSIWDLVARSRAIADNLEDTILRLERRLQGHWPKPTDEMTGYSKEMLITIMTNIFACAAAVYLQVVVCGIQPALPEIRNSVERTIKAMQHLPKEGSGRLSRGLLWPTCIAGSVAESQHQPIFREFIQNAINDSKSFGNAETALEIMEASWQALNQQQPYSPASTSSIGNETPYVLKSWPHVIQWSGNRVLLV